MPVLQFSALHILLVRPGMLFLFPNNQTCQLWHQSSAHLQMQVWDSLGRLLYQSAPLQSSITAVAWSLTSEMFAVGCYNSLLLCHASGWLYSKVHVLRLNRCRTYLYPSAVAYEQVCRRLAECPYAPQGVLRRPYGSDQVSNHDFLVH